LEDEYENIAAIHFVEEQAGFLAGALAAMVTESGKVGAICETSGIDAVWRYCEGFREGALYADDDVDIYIKYRESGSRDKIFNDPEWGKQQALHLIDDGADILSGFGGNTTQGAFLAAVEKGILIIGAEEDLYFRLPDVQPVLVTSVIKEPSSELSYLVLMASQGEFSIGPHAGQITYSPLQNLRSQAPDEIDAQVEEIYAALLEGIMEVNLPEKD
jgi:basic membrane protein A